MTREMMMRVYLLVREEKQKIICRKNYMQKKHEIKKLYADKAHHCRRNVNLLDEQDIEPPIEMRNNAYTRMTYC